MQWTCWLIQSSLELYHWDKRGSDMASRGLYGVERMLIQTLCIFFDLRVCRCSQTVELLCVHLSRLVSSLVFLVPYFLNKTGCPSTQSLPSSTFSKACFSLFHPHHKEWINFAIDQFCINYARQLLIRAFFRFLSS